MLSYFSLYQTLVALGLTESVNDLSLLLSVSQYRVIGKFYERSIVIHDMIYSKII